MGTDVHVWVVPNGLTSDDAICDFTVTAGVPLPRPGDELQLQIKNTATPPYDEMWKPGLIVRKVEFQVRQFLPKLMASAMLVTIYVDMPSE